jgi:NADPH:quinone reductase-like Zn-dependent oxidoreductase
MATATCVWLQGAGGPEQLVVRDEPVPVPGPGRVRLRVRTAGVAYADVMMRHGVYPNAPRFPFVPGFDVVGVVDALGEGVDATMLGRRMAAVTFVGGYAEFIVVDPKRLVEVPPGVSDEAAVAAVLNYATAYQMLVRLAQVELGQTVLVHGAAGGVGNALLDLCRTLGVRALGTCSAGKFDAVRALGGEPIDYRNQRFEDLLAARSIKPAAVFDHLGGAHLWRSRRVLDRDGVLVSYGFADAVKGGGGQALVRRTFGNLLMMKLLPGPSIRFYAILTTPFSQRQHLKHDLDCVFRLLAAGRIRPRIAEVLPLRQAAMAHQRLEAAQVAGKIVLRCDQTL